MKIRGVNLGNWRILEKWMSPKLYDGHSEEELGIIRQSFYAELIESMSSSRRLHDEKTRMRKLIAILLMASILTPLAAASLLVFSLLYTPCVAAFASVRRELGGKWALYVVAAQCVIAWAAAFLVHLIGMIAGLA